MKKLLVLVMMLVPLLANAVVVEIDGISYVLTSKTKEAEVIQNANGYSGEIFIPESVEYDGEKYNVVSIGEKAFYLCSGLTAVKLPNGLLSIGNNAFSYCSGLTSITIPQSLNSIGELAFANCNSLSSVHISDLEKWCNIEYAFISSGDTQSRFFEPYHLFLNEEPQDFMAPTGRLTQLSLEEPGEWMQTLPTGSLLPATSCLCVTGSTGRDDF